MDSRIISWQFDGSMVIIRELSNGGYQLVTYVGKLMKETTVPLSLSDVERLRGKS